jgi:hypothetical protein
MVAKPVSTAAIVLGVTLLLVGSAAQSFAFVHRGTTVHHRHGPYHRGTTAVGPEGRVYHHGTTAGRYGGVYHRGTTAIGPNGAVYHRGGTVVAPAAGAVVAPAAAGAVVAPVAAGAVVAPVAAGAVVAPVAAGAVVAAPSDAATPAGSSAASAPETPASATSAVAAATKPDRAQIDAIRHACRADYGVHCAAIPPGGQAALTCLQQHASLLSAGCQQAIGAVGSAPAAPVAPPAAALPAPAPAAPVSPVVAAPAVGAPEQGPRATLRDLLMLRRACGPDFRAYCGGIRPGDGRIVDCLQANRASLSRRCKSALTSL